MSHQDLYEKEANSESKGTHHIYEVQESIIHNDDHSTLNTDFSDIEDDKRLEDFQNYQIPFKQRLRLFFSNKEPKNSSEKKELFFWNPPGQSKYEKKLVFKMDCLILTYVCLSFFIRYLDASNITNAYVSGMKEDLHMHGAMYNWLTRAFYIPYAVAGLPLTLLVTKVRPHILLPTLELLWSIACMAVAATNSYKQIAGVRAIQGALEGSCFPILHYLLGSWYTKNELSTRTALFIASGSLGTMFGGYIQSGVYKSMNGLHGLPGWKWIFIIDGIVSVFVAVLGFFVIPDTPWKPRPNRFLTEEDFEYARKRVKVMKKVKTTDKFNFTIIRKLLTSWQFYLFNIYYTVGHLPSEVGSFWGVVLKKEGYSVYQANNYPTIQSAVDVLSTVLAGLFVDVRGKKFEGATIVFLLWTLAISLLVAWDVGKAGRFFAFALTGMSGAASTLCCSWANELTREDEQLRAGVLGSFNFVLQGPSTAFSILAYNTDYAPKFEKGNRISLGICVSGLATTYIVLWFDRYQRRKRDYVEEQAALGLGQSVSVENKA